ncbi:MAG TPA: hypothetical protein VFU29_01615 [Chitinophagaceae bacterium]|nr:hypothetical protein [Chitinophagaceae bacterium]
MKIFKINLILILFFSILVVACGSKSPAPPPPSEQSIAFTHNAGNNVLNPGPSLNFNVTLTSAMPAAGIKVEVSTKEEASGNTVGTNSSVNSTSATVNVGVSGLPRQLWCIVNIKVTSVSTASNSATQTFRIVYK